MTRKCDIVQVLDRSEQTKFKKDERVGVVDGTLFHSDDTYRGYAVRRSSRPTGPYQDQELHWLAAKPGFDAAFGLLNLRFGFQLRNS